MKKIMRRVLGAALAVVMSVGLLSGCGGEADPIKEAFDGKYTKDTVMLTVNGSDVTAEDLFFWMAQNADYVAGYYTQMGMEMDWSSAMGQDATMGEHVKEQSKETAVLYNIVAAQAAANGYTMTDEDRADYEADLDSAKEQLGGDKEYETWLKTMLITDEGMERLSSVGVLYTHMMEGMFQDSGEQAATAEDLAQYAQDNDLLWAKHILLMTKDAETGEDLAAEDAAAKKAQAEELLAQLQGITDPQELSAKFDELMNEYSEDTGLESNPDGYVFTAGQMVEEFENATRDLEFGQRHRGNQLRLPHHPASGPRGGPGDPGRLGERTDGRPGSGLGRRGRGDHHRGLRQPEHRGLLRRAGGLPGNPGARRGGERGHCRA